MMILADRVVQGVLATGGMVRVGVSPLRIITQLQVAVVGPGQRDRATIFAIGIMLLRTILREGVGTRIAVVLELVGDIWIGIDIREIGIRGSRSNSAGLRREHERLRFIKAGRRLLIHEVVLDRMEGV